MCSGSVVYNVKPKSRDNSPTCPAARRGEESVFPTCDVAGGDILYYRGGVATPHRRATSRARARKGERVAAAITIRTQLLKNAQKKLSCYNRAWVGLRGAAAREAAREAAATAAATVAVKAVAAVAATAAARVAAATAVGCGEGGGWWWMDEGDRRCVYVWREEGCVGLSRRRPAVRGPL